MAVELAYVRFLFSGMKSNEWIILIPFFDVKFIEETHLYKDMKGELPFNDSNTMYVIKFDPASLLMFRLEAYINQEEKTHKVN